MTTEFVQANHLMRQGCYSDAIRLYYLALKHSPELAEIISFNIKFSQRQISKKSIASKYKNEIQLNEINSAPKKNCLAKLGIVDVNNIKVQASPNSFFSLGEDPYFIIDPESIGIRPEKWYQLKIKIKIDRKRATSKLYIDKGFGFSEEDSLILQIDNNSQVERIFFIEKNVTGLRYDPIEFKGEFDISLFEIEEINKFNAKDLMLKKVCKESKEFVGFSVELVWSKLVEKAKKEHSETLDLLYRIYNETFIENLNTVDYQEWIECLEKPSLPSRDQVCAAIQNMKDRPTISIIVPVYNTPEKYLRACIESVLAQSYPNWELCISDDKSPKSEVQQILDEYRKKDMRIRVTYRSINGHISAASNSALELATGDFVALLDHDDELAPHALYFMVQAINAHPKAQIFYSDEDKIDKEGKRFEPHFKSDWNPDLFFSQNYVSHLGVYNRGLLARIKGFRVGLEGSQDQDLLLRCLPHVKAEHIVHVPRVLYHWRTVEGSTALSSGEKSYTTEAGIRALRDYFSTILPGRVHVEAGQIPNIYRVRWEIPSPIPLVSLLIPTRDKKKITEVAVRSILEKTTYPNYEIVILDNGSVEEDTLRFFEKIQLENERVRVLSYDYPFNYSAINNFGVSHAFGSVIGLINNDVEVISPDWLTEMVSHAVREDIGCVGAKLYYSNNTLQHGGVILGIQGVANHSHKNANRSSYGYFGRLICSQNLSAVTAACMLVRKDIYEEVGGLDEENLKVAFNDVDFCLKVQNAGYRNLWTPYAELYHHESVSRGIEDTPEKKLRFRLEVEYMMKRWGETLKQDIYYNPNLTKSREDFSINCHITEQCG